jgi:hypothetical protein
MLLPTAAMLDQYLPDYDVRARHSIKIAAPIEQVYPVARSLDLSDSLLIRALFAVRSLGRHTSLRDLEAIGFLPLVEDPMRGFVLGLIGQFWKPSGRLVPADSAEFLTFDQHGFAKAAWSFELTANDRGTTLVTETRVLCLDEASRRSFRRYWRVIGPFSGLVRKEALRIIKRRAEDATSMAQPEATPEVSP